MGEIRVGKPDVKPDAPSHTKGVPQGNTGLLRPAAWSSFRRHSR